MSSAERPLTVHLARRAGFGATPDELDTYEAMGYDAVVEHLLNPTESRHTPDDLVFRRHVDLHAAQGHTAPRWAYRMVTTKCPLEEKIALFWHGVFATVEVKLNNIGSLENQIDMFRRHGLGRLDGLLAELSKDPAMIIWLDNQTNHKGAINENYGREVLELFSMGAGNYSEADIKECARAFTGWTVRNAEYMALMGQKDSIWPYGRLLWHFEYRDDDHDDEEKVFLGERGRFNGEDIIDIICRQPATAWFIARHLYNFFVADEVPVSQWSYTPPRDPEALKTLADSYVESGHEIRSVLRTLFHSDFFKEASFSRVKSPAELVVGTLRMTGECTAPDGKDTTAYQVMDESGFMGQALLNPPSVEGWHTGEEWITSGALVDRVNFAAGHVGDLSNPGVRRLVDRIVDDCGPSPTADQLVDACLDVAGPLTVSEEVRGSLIEVASRDGNPHLGGYPDDEGVDHLMEELLKTVVSSREYQLG